MLLWKDEMRDGLFEFGLLYALLVGNFCYQSNGFVKFYDDRYCLWKLMKLTPIVALALFTYFHGAGLNERSRRLHALGIVFGGIGDWLIGNSKEGIVVGAIAFGIGHLFYMSLFVPGSFKIAPSMLIGAAVWGLIANQLCLMPMFQEHPIPVAIMIIYSLLLTACFILSYSQYALGNNKLQAGHEALWYRFIGFALFYASDNLLIFDHVGYPVPLSEVLILGTYYGAQFLILKGQIDCEVAELSVAKPRKKIS
ncbi:unnamed protein product, partial [Mesorhabditis belari]|uniref:lysoplasmalogenase n=1 Tax=Mesorhabditis belari TaxID=2138241 RepID=A0AAF3EEP6_9BILA